MPTIEQAQAEIQQAQENLDRNKRELDEAQQQAQNIRNQRIPQRRVYPTITRKQQLAIQSENNKRQAIKQQALNEIGQARQQLSSYQSQINTAKDQVLKAKADQEAYKLASKVYHGEAPVFAMNPGFYTDPYDRLKAKLAQQYYRNMMLSLHDAEEYKSDFESKNPGIILNLDKMSLRFTGITNLTTGENLSIKEYNQNIKDTGQGFPTETVTIREIPAEHKPGIIARDYVNGGQPTYYNAQTGEQIKQPAMTAYKGFTPSEQEFNKYASSYYNENSVSSKIGGYAKTLLDNAKSMIGDAYQGAKNFLVGQKYESDYYNEAFGIKLVPNPNDKSGKGTMVAGQNNDNQLSAEALLIKKRTNEEFIEQLKTYNEVKNLQQTISEKYSAELNKNLLSGQRTQEDIDALIKDTQDRANIDFEQQVKSIQDNYVTGFNQREQERQQEVMKAKHPITAFINKLDKEISDFINLPDLPKPTDEKTFNLYVQTKGIIAPEFFKAFEYSASFGSGVYTGLKDQPVTTVKNLGIGIALGLVTSGAGAVATRIGITEVLPGVVTSSTSFLAKYALPTAYGASVLFRSYDPNDINQSFYNLGQITAVEVVPLVAGAKFGGYVVERVALKYDFAQQIKQLPPELQDLYKAEMQQLKAYKNLDVEVRELDLTQISRLSPEAQNAVKEFLTTNKLFTTKILGGSASQSTQLLVDGRTPNDLDIFVSGNNVKQAQKLFDLFQKYGANEYYLSDYKILTASGEKAVEVEPLSMLKQNIEQVIPIYRTYRFGVTETPEGIDVLKLDVQAVRKLEGGLRQPVARFKDLIDYANIKKTFEILAQNSDVQLNINEIPTVKLNTKLPEIEQIKTVLTKPNVNFQTPKLNVDSYYYYDFLDSYNPYIKPSNYKTPVGYSQPNVAYSNPELNYKLPSMPTTPYLPTTPTNPSPSNYNVPSPPYQPPALPEITFLLIDQPTKTPNAKVEYDLNDDIKKIIIQHKTKKPIQKDIWYNPDFTSRILDLKLVNADVNFKELGAKTYSGLETRKLLQGLY